MALVIVDKLLRLALSDALIFKPLHDGFLDLTAVSHLACLTGLQAQDVHFIDLGRLEQTDFFCCPCHIAQ